MAWPRKPRARARSGYHRSGAAGTPTESRQCSVRDATAWVDQLPRELAAARGLSRDQCELVIDEAIDYMVTEYSKPIADEHVLERAFWATAAFRVKRMHEGRGATVRAGWQRVDVADVEIASRDADPAAHVIRGFEHGALLEFAATLTEPERRVLACKFADGPKEQGRVVVARRLAIPLAEVRRAERAIARKLDRFIAIVAAGSLCTHRGSALEALAGGVADAQQELAARAHLSHCSSCRLGYAEHLRALRSGELPHRIAQLLPIPAAAIEPRRRGAPWDAIGDWASRPFTADASTTGAHLAAGGRGIGAAATAKLAALCIGGVTAVGGGAYCVTTVLQPEPPRERRQQSEAPARPVPASAREPRLPSAGPALTAIRETEERQATERRQARRQRAEGRTAFGGSGDPSTRHEREAPISPPIETAGAEISEFEPGPAGPVTQAPATAPATGAPEFP